jgi:hypothetical protein
MNYEALVALPEELASYVARNLSTSPRTCGNLKILQCKTQAVLSLVCISQLYSFVLLIDFSEKHPQPHNQQEHAKSSPQYCSG